MGVVCDSYVLEYSLQFDLSRAVFKLGYIIALNLRINYVNRSKAALKNY